MHPPRIRSAPAGRTKGKKATATKDIEEWVHSGKDQDVDTSRIHSGQLTENVTEERLLRSRLMELGKERFKILSKCDHEIQAFKDKQNRKGIRGTLARPMSAFDRRSSLSARSLTSRTNEPDGASLVLITPGVRQKNVQFQVKPTKTECVKINERQSYTRPQTVPAKMPRQQPGPILEEWKPLTMTNEWSRPSTASGVVTNGRHGPSVSALTTLKDERVGLRKVSSEPRFTALESCLTENYTSSCKVDVKSIIESITSLKIPIRAGSKEAKRELENKIKLFMEENNIVF